MADEDVDALRRKIDEIGQKLDKLSASVDQRFAEVAKTAEVNEHFAELRRYTEFTSDTLRTELRTDMHAGFQRVDRRLGRIEDKLDRFILTQGGINQDHELRLRALQRRRPRRKS